MKKLIILLISGSTFAQSAGKVGVNTTQPTETLDVNGKIRQRVIEEVSTAQYVVVVDSDGVYKKMLLSAISGNNNGTCPNFLRSQSSGYNLYFSSTSSIPKPTDPLVIGGRNFISSVAYIQSNTYFYGYSNTSGNPINITNLTVNFSGLICNYN